MPRGIRGPVGRPADDLNLSKGMWAPRCRVLAMEGPGGNLLATSLERAGGAFYTMASWA